MDNPEYQENQSTVHQDQQEMPEGLVNPGSPEAQERQDKMEDQERVDLANIAHHPEHHQAIKHIYIKFFNNNFFIILLFI